MEPRKIAGPDFMHMHNTACMHNTKYMHMHMHMHMFDNGCNMQHAT